MYVYFCSDTSEIPGTLSAYGDEVFKSGTETFHPTDDAVSIKSDVLDDKDQNSQPPNATDEDLNSQPLHPPDAYDRLGQPLPPPDEDLKSQPLHPPDAYDKLLTQPLHPPNPYAEVVQLPNPPDVYDKLAPQKVRYVRVY